MTVPSERSENTPDARDIALNALLRENARLEIAELEGQLLARNQERLMDFVQRVTARMDDDDLMDVIVEEFLIELKVDRVSYILVGQGEQAAWAVSNESATPGVKRLAIPYFVSSNPDSDFIRFLDQARQNRREPTLGDWQNSTLIQPARHFMADMEEEFQAALEEEFGLARFVECRSAMAFPVETTLGGTSLFVVQRVKGETGFSRYQRDLFLRMCRYAASLLEQRQLSEQVSDLKDRFSSLIESMPSGIIGMDLLGTVTTWNGKASEWFGLAAEDAIGQVFWELVPAFRFVNEALRDALQVPGAGRDFEPFPFERAGRPQLWLKANLFTMFSRDRGEVALRVDDVTRTVDLHHQLFQAQRMEVVGTLAGGLSRQLGDLVAGLVSSAGLLKERCKSHSEASRDPSLMRDLDLLLENASLTATLVEDMQTLAHGPEEPRENFDLSAMTRHLVGLCKRAFEPKVQLVAQIADSPCLIRGERSRVEQAILNICLNAREAMAGGGILTLDLSRAPAPREWEGPEGSWLRLAIGDTGPGMNEETLSHIFNPYFTTKGNTGSGLGLAIVEAVMQNHGGKVLVESRRERGTTFQLWFPEVQDKPAGAVSHDSPMGGHGDILLLIHDERLRQTSTRVLEELGYTVTAFPNGASALKFVEQGLVFDLAVIDIDLPVLNGITTSELLLRQVHHLPILLCAGKGREEGLDDLLQRRHCHLLSKPFGMAQLAMAVREAINAPSTRTG